MNLFISSDIEGTCGIAAWSETEPAGRTGITPILSSR